MQTIVAPNLTAADALQTTRTLSGAIVASGTSRLLVLDRPAFRDDEERNAVLLALLVGDGRSPALGGNHYQENKAVIVSCMSPERVAYRFLQVDRKSRTVGAGLECSNSAIAAAVYAARHGACSLEQGGVEALNEASRHGLRISETGRPALGRYRVQYPGCRPFVLRDDLWVGVHGNACNAAMVRSGHYFAFIDASGCGVDLSSTEQTRIYDDLLSRCGHYAGLEQRTLKLVLFEQSAQPDRYRVACYYGGDRHRSLPGTAAIALACRLYVTRRSPGTHTDLLFESEARDVRVLTEACADGSFTSSFDMDARILICGDFTRCE